VHKANLGSQLSIFDTGSFARATPSPERPARTSSHGRPQTTRPNDFAWAPERPKRSDKGEPGKRAARTCTKPTSGHNLAFLIRARSPGRALARTTRPNEFTRAPSNDLPEPARTTETKRQGRAGQMSCTNVHKANLGSQLSIFDTGSFARARPRPNSKTTRPNDRNEPTRESRANELHERAQSQPRVTT
jgi:hypothetical protein